MLLKLNRRLLPALAGLIVLGVPVISPAVQAQSYAVIHAGDRGPAAKVAQTSRSPLGDYHGPLDSIIGVQSLTAVKLFQGRYGLAQDGIPGPFARGELSATAGAPETNATADSRSALPLKLNSRGALVTRVQRLLHQHGYTIKADGRFGPLTYAAVRTFQASHRLTVNGIVDSQTLAALEMTRVASNTASPQMEAPPPQYPPGYLHEGDTGASVRLLQHDLTVLGYPTGGVDGIFGAMTLHAVEAFQRDQGLPAHGLVGSLTWGAIHRLLSQKRAGAPVALSNRGSVSATASAVIGLALKYLGYPYVYGGNTPTTGFDCSGFVQWVYAQVGISLPRTTFTQWNVGTHVSYDQLEPGDLVFFTTEGVFANHVGIYLGNGQFISATEPGTGVMIQSLNLPFFAQAYDGAVQVIQ